MDDGTKDHFAEDDEEAASEEEDVEEEESEVEEEESEEEDDSEEEASEAEDATLEAQSPNPTHRIAETRREALTQVAHQVARLEALTRQIAEDSAMRARSASSLHRGANEPG